MRIVATALIIALAMGGVGGIWRPEIAQLASKVRVYMWLGVWPAAVYRSGLVSDAYAWDRVPSNEERATVLGAAQKSDWTE